MHGRSRIIWPWIGERGEERERRREGVEERGAVEGREILPPSRIECWYRCLWDCDWEFDVFDSRLSWDSGVEEVCRGYVALCPGAHTWSGGEGTGQVFSVCVLSFVVECIVLCDSAGCSRGL